MLFKGLLQNENFIVEARRENNNKIEEMRIFTQKSLFLNIMRKLFAFFSNCLFDYVLKF